MALRLAKQYKPDALIIAVYPNDISKRWMPRERNVIKSNSRSQRLKYLLKRSAIVATTYSAYRGYRARKALNTNPHWEQKVIQGNNDLAMEQAWTQVETSLRSIRDWSESMEIRVLVIALPHRAQVSGIMAGRAYNQRLRDVAQRNGIPFMDLLPALNAAYDRHGSELFIPWDGHNSALTNKVVAEQVYQQMYKAIAFRGSTP